MPVTARDIARELNLSQPTVSRILSRDGQHRAADETRRLVEETARRLGYQPNAVARSLRRGRTGIVGIHTGHSYDVRNDFLRHIVGALQCACSEHRLDLLLHRSIQGAGSEDMAGRLSDGRIDGLILHTRPTDPLVELLSQSALPVVAVADPLPGLAAVTSDDASGMRLLVENLWERGYRRFVFLAPHLRLSSVERRREAFEHAMTQCGLTASAWCVIGIDFEKAAPVLPILCQLSGASPEPLAVCCWNDRTAYDLLRACAEKDVGVPATFAVAGFDGFRDEKMPARELVTVQCRWDDVGRTALDLLVSMIDANQFPGRKPETGPPREISLPVVFLDGDTA